ncbi:MAG TPA: hypothetical protein VI636_06315 [Candidatus Angelobacter sp.]
MTTRRYKMRSQAGYILLSIMLLITLMLLTLSIELPRISQQIKREKEEELIHRGNEYKSAIRKFFRKFGRYPLSIDQLENTNNMRFLRKRYKDPFTGKDDWRLLHPGEVQVNVLNQGVAAPGQPMGQSTSNVGQPAGFGNNQPAGFGANQPATFGANPTTPSPTGAQPDQTQGQNNAGMTPASSMPGAQGPGGLSTGLQPGMGPIIGVSSISKLESIKEINGKNHYNDWQFVYDPRLEQQMPGQMQPGANQINPVGGSTPGQFNPAGPGQMNPAGPGQMNPAGPGQMNPPPASGPPRSQ